MLWHDASIEFKPYLLTKVGSPHCQEFYGTTISITHLFQTIGIPFRQTPRSQTKHDGFQGTRAMKDIVHRIQLHVFTGTLRIVSVNPVERVDPNLLAMILYR